MIINNSLSSIVITLLISSFVTTAQAALIALPSHGTSFWNYAGPGTRIDLSSNGDFSHSFSLVSPTTVSIVADDCCAAGDVFGLILDSTSTLWTYTDTTNSIYGPGLFHGVYTEFLGAGLHTFSLEVTADCCGFGQMDWSIFSPIPEPETYIMLLAGLGLLGFALGRKKKLTT